MFGSTVLDVVLGITFVYLLLSVICSTLKEWISGMFDMRANTLEIGIKRLLVDDNVRKQFYAHPIISGLSKETTSNGVVKPSYIAATDFAGALIDVLAPAGRGPTTFTGLRSTIEALPDENTRRTLLVLIDKSEGDVTLARKNVEAWFDSSMERVSGWYKRKIQKIIIGLAFIITVISNADTFVIVDALWKQPAIRQGVASAAEKYVTNNPKPAEPLQSTLVDTSSQSKESSVNQVGVKIGDVKLKDQKSTTSKEAAIGGNNESKTKTYESLNEELKSLQLPLGWSEWVKKEEHDYSEKVSKILGLIITWIAVSLGAPFWFDVAGKLVNLRNTGKKPLTSADNKSN